MKHVTLLSLVVLLSACGTQIQEEVIPTTITDSQSSVATSQSSSEDVVTTITGVVEPIGITIYQQGTHKITTNDGNIVLLESSSVDLNGYVNEVVDIIGVVRATVEADGKIMLVQQIALGEPVASASSSSEEASDSSNSDSQNSSDETSEVSDASEENVSSESASSEQSIEASEQSESSSSAAEVVSSDDPKVQSMQSANLASSQWTQEYCSRQVPYCFPIHRNWWYTAFGATTNELMRVDIGPEEITTVGDGVIKVRLVSGATTKSNGTQNATAYGYATFGDQHFEISAPAALQEAVSYIADNISQTN